MHLDSHCTMHLDMLVCSTVFSLEECQVLTVVLILLVELLRVTVGPLWSDLGCFLWCPLGLLGATLGDLYFMGLPLEPPLGLSVSERERFCNKTCSRFGLSLEASRP